MKKIFSRQTFWHNRVYHCGEDCLVDITTVTTIFGHVFKKIQTIAMPHGHVCNSCMRSGDYGSCYKMDCIDCPLP